MIADFRQGGREELRIEYGRVQNLGHERRSEIEVDVGHYSCDILTKFLWLRLLMLVFWTARLMLRNVALHSLTDSSTLHENRKECDPEQSDILLPAATHYSQGIMTA